MALTAARALLIALMALLACACSQPSGAGGSKASAPAASPSNGCEKALADMACVGRPAERSGQP
jgi:hypothetical protein